jgi:hypothetical protein
LIKPDSHTSSGFGKKEYVVTSQQIKKNTERLIVIGILWAGVYFAAIINSASVV